MGSVDDINDALRDVIDPELGLDFVELGLIYDVEIEGGTVKITYSLTTPACPIGPHVSEQIDELVTEFATSGPVKHVIIDNFLDTEFAQKLFDDLPDPNAMPKSRDYMFSDKRELSTLDRHSDISKQLHAVFMSQEFAQLASKLVGHEVFLDPEYTGGGFHAGSEGSFLDFHVDYNIHPVREDWLRELNILLYLNPGWEQSWGGELLLTDDPRPR